MRVRLRFKLPASIARNSRELARRGCGVTTIRSSGQIWSVTRDLPGDTSGRQSCFVLFLERHLRVRVLVSVRFRFSHPAFRWWSSSEIPRGRRQYGAISVQPGTIEVRKKGGFLAPKRHQMKYLDFASSWFGTRGSEV
jgi:hypothetical protein